MSGKLLQTQGGEFIRIRMTGDRLTMWIEGRDQDGPSVAGTALDGDQVDELIGMLMVYKVNHFRVRDSGKPPRRQDIRRQGDKTEIKLKQLYPPEGDKCRMCGDRSAIHSGVCNTCALEHG